MFLQDYNKRQTIRTCDNHWDVIKFTQNWPFSLFYRFINKKKILTNLKYCSLVQLLSIVDSVVYFFFFWSNINFNQQTPSVSYFVLIFKVQFCTMLYHHRPLQPSAPFYYELNSNFRMYSLLFCFPLFKETFLFNLKCLNWKRDL